MADLLEIHLAASTVALLAATMASQMVVSLAACLALNWAALMVWTMVAQ